MAGGGPQPETLQTSVTHLAQPLFVACMAVKIVELSLLILLSKCTRLMHFTLNSKKKCVEGGYSMNTLILIDNI